MENKKLSNWLIASDIDGTLNDKSRRLVRRNYDAIHKYIEEYGGHFTLASGRNPESMRKHFERLDIPNGKAVVINGAGSAGIAIANFLRLIIIFGGRRRRD